jgi:uncharacterized metal-binding protein YceD (DUF177 family)
MGECTGDTFIEEVDATHDEAIVDSPFSILEQLKRN